MVGDQSTAGDQDIAVMSANAGAPANIVAQLRERIQRLEGSRSGGGERLLSTGCTPLDSLLPEAGFRPGILVEWLGDKEGSGAQTLAMLAAREAIAGGRVLVVMDRRREFYPPAAAALGIDLQRTFVVRAARLEEELWALDQALRCPGVGATWAVVDQLDWRWFRRLQLAAEQGGGLGLLVRPEQARGQPSWSQVQLWVQPRASVGSRRMRVEITHCKGVAPGGSVDLELDEETGEVRAAPVTVPRSGACPDRRHETHTLPLAAQLAHPASRRRSARA
jgi:hypothetical protein